MEKIKLLIADDHPMIKSGLTQIFEQSSVIEVFAQASNGQELIHILKQQKVDVVLVDINMPRMNGIEACQKIKILFGGKVRVLVFSQYDDKRFVKRVMKCGASGYLLKNAPADEVVNAIRIVHNGGVYMSQALPDILGTTNTDIKTDKLFPDISRREMDVLRLICEEKSTAEIAETLFISPHTVESHRARLLQKVGAKNTAGLVKWAMENEIMDHHK